VAKRLEQLGTEASKAAANESLSEQERVRIARDKYEIFLQPVVAILDHVHHVTIRLAAETPNELQFQVSTQTNRFLLNPFVYLLSTR